MNDLEIVNTKNKIFNLKRRTYLDNTDLKEGESFCRKCKGRGEVTKGHWDMVDTCPQCLGRGIVDWVTQAVKRPPLVATDSSSSVSDSLYNSNFKTDWIKGIFMYRKVTNFKRRKIV